MLSEIEKCTGCSACKWSCNPGAIELYQNEEGFYYPIIDKKICIECGKCLKICPVNKRINRHDEFFPISYAAWNKNAYICSISSSGGLFTSLSEWIFRQGGAVVGAAFSDDFEKVQHMITYSMDELDRLRRSKYVQSNLYDVFPKIRSMLERNMYILFVGTPCQAAGLYSFLEKPYEKLFICDLICFGVNSPGVFCNYIKQQEKRYGGRTIYYSFRDKTVGWRTPTIKQIFNNKKEYVVECGKDPFYYGFINRLYFRKSCSECSFKGSNRFSDLTLGDLWGVEKYYPQCDSQYRGTSLVVVNTEKGKKILSECEHQVSLVQVELEKAVEKNAMYYKSMEHSSIRNKFFSDFNSLRYEKIEKKYLKKKNKFTRVLNKVKTILFKLVRNRRKKSESKEFD